MNWSQASVEKVVVAMRSAYLNWAADNDVNSSTVGKAFPVVAKSALFIIAELPEVRKLVEALQYYDDYEQFKGQSFIASNALAAFTNKGE